MRERRVNPRAWPWHVVLRRVVAAAAYPRAWPWRVVLRRAVAIAAAAYPVGLLAAWIVFRTIGERWVVSGVALYLPPVVFATPLPVLVAAIVLTRQPRWLGSQAAAALIVVFPLMGLRLPHPLHEHPSGPTFRVLSYNIQGGEGPGGYPALVAEIDRYAPDVVFIDEVLRADKMTALLRDRYPTVLAVGQFIIASKLPVLEAPGTPPPPPGPRIDRAHWPAYVRTVFDTPIGRVVGYAVHPPSPRGAFEKLRVQGRTSNLISRMVAAHSGDSAEFYENAADREAGTQEYARAALAEGDPVFLAGDTNLPDLSPLSARYLSPFHDAFHDVGWGFGYTFPNDKWLPAWLRLDRILATKGLRFTSFGRGRSRASDHACVVADVAR